MDRPNILFVLIDDLGCRDLGCFGSTFYETPRLDALAVQGMVFDRAYASCPVCSPSRASVLSGKYPARVGVTQYIGGHGEGKLKEVPYLHYLPLEEQSVAATLRDAGYQTWHVGKWHLGDEDFYPEKHGFDVNVGGSHWGHPMKGYFSPYEMPGLSDGPEGEYLTDRLTDEAIALIRNRGDAPFFMHLSHYAVHTPIQSPPDLVEKYKRKAKALHLDAIDPMVDGEYHGKLALQDRQVRRRIVQSDPAYAAMIENLDTNIGRVLDALAEEGIADDTLVVFTSDNGGLATSEGSPTCNLPQRDGKGWNHEGGTRVCQMVRWPGTVSAGTRCFVPVTSTDFYPTFLEAAGLPLMPEQHVDGVSLMPVLNGARALDREAIFWHYPHYSNQGGRPAASMVQGEWKLIENYEDRDLELYNLEVDPSEQQNLADTESERAHAMHALLRAWQQDVTAKIPESNPDYEKLLKRPAVPNNAED